ncbi:hypothetical protein ACHAWU_005115 [Discostella pseudostelligera]|uniref:Uncharacterized protein n=1 Tax=Discostella pseudostelligera TaxID=259834 RepID=A0ABD3LZE9_9STRA
MWTKLIGRLGRKLLDANDAPLSIISIENCVFNGNKGNSTIIVSSNFEELLTANQGLGSLGTGGRRYLETPKFAHWIHLVINGTSFTTEAVNGAIIDNHGGRLQLSSCIYANNTAESVIKSEYGTLVMTSSEFDTNEMTSDAGVFVLDSESSLGLNEFNCDASVPIRVTVVPVSIMVAIALPLIHVTRRQQRDNDRAGDDVAPSTINPADTTTTPSSLQKERTTTAAIPASSMALLSVQIATHLRTIGEIDVFTPTLQSSWYNVYIPSFAWIDVGEYNSVYDTTINISRTLLLCSPTLVSTHPSPLRGKEFALQALTLNFPSSSWDEVLTASNAAIGGPSTAAAFAMGLVSSSGRINNDNNKNNESRRREEQHRSALVIDATVWGVFGSAIAIDAY